MHPHSPTAGNFTQTMFFLPLCFYIWIPRSPSHVETRFLKTMKVLFLILAEDSMIIIRKTAEFERMALHMRHLDFSGRSLVQKSLVKNWRINSMNPLCSHWITMITPVRKTSLRHWSEISIQPGMPKEATTKPFSRQSVWQAWSWKINSSVTLEMNVQTDGWKKFLQNMLLPSLRAIPRQKIPISLYFRNLFPAKNAFRKPTLLLWSFRPTGAVTVSSHRKKNIPWITNAVFLLPGLAWKAKSYLW